MPSNSLSTTSSIVVLTFILLSQISCVNGESFKCVKDGFFADKRDCWIYHICVGSTHSVKACKEDLLFNPLKNECDWAMNVRHEWNQEELFLSLKIEFITLEFFNFRLIVQNRPNLMMLYLHRVSFIRTDTQVADRFDYLSFYRAKFSATNAHHQ